MSRHAMGSQFTRYKGSFFFQLKFVEKSIIDTVKKAVHLVVRSTRGKIVCLQVEYHDKLLADVANLHYL